MAEKGQDANRLNQYKYSAMSNLVLQADRRFTSRRGDENTGDPESLAGRVNITDMGSGNAREQAPVQPKAEGQDQPGSASGQIQRSLYAQQASYHSKTSTSKV